jgi:putative SOS response-associated peptidase YedK
MPVILLKEDHDRWLRGSFDDALAVQASYPSQLMALT